MNFSVRSSAAAAALLVATFGTLAVATPVAAQPARVAPPAIAAPHLQIERFVMQQDGPLRPGSELRFRMNGVPGVQAWVEIPGVKLVQLTEVRPGLYEGSYVVQRRDQLGAFDRANGILKSGTQRVTARVDARSDRAGRGWEHRDREAPRIADLSPAQGERVSERGRTRITARVADQGSGVESVSLRLDGRDVSSAVRIEGENIRYTEDLQPGRHSAEIAVRDRAGNVARQRWFFDVAHNDHGRRDGRDSNR
jgi:hypothetical protein